MAQKFGGMNHLRGKSRTSPEAGHVEAAGAGGDVGNEEPGSMVNWCMLLAAGRRTGAVASRSDRRIVVVDLHYTWRIGPVVAAFVDHTGTGHWHQAIPHCSAAHRSHGPPVYIHGPDCPP